MKQATVIWFNFEDLGFEGWCPIEPTESQLMLTAAESLLEKYSPADLNEIVERQRQGLVTAALTNHITEEWISQALLYRAICGLMGRAIPDVRHYI